MFSDRRTGRKLVTVLVLLRMSLRVLSGKASVNVACLSHGQDRVAHRCTVGRRCDVVLIGQDDDLAAFTAAQAAAGGSDTASTRTAQTVLPQEENRAVTDQIGSLIMPLLAEEESLRGVRRAGSVSAMQTTSTTLVVAGLIGLLGVAGAAALIVHSVTGPVRRAVGALQAPVEGRLNQRLRLTTPDELPDVSRAPDTAGRRGESSVETGSVVAVIASVVQQAQLLALDATIERARASSVGAGSAAIAKGAEELAQEAAKAAEAMTATSTPVGSTVGTIRYAAARGRALGPTTALWHAVQLDRLVGAIEGACETTVCGSLVRMSTELGWPAAARDVCPTCATLAH
jgi:hypothetical protein